MDKTFFGCQVDRLRGVYSPGALNEERINIWWKQFKDTPNHVFESALSHIIAEATTQALPAMSKIAEACGFFRADLNSVGRAEVTSFYKCEPCGDSGWLAKDYDRRTGAGIVIACKCAAARGLGPADLVKIQKSFDRGAKFMRGGGSPFPELPYDPSERIGGGA